MEVIKRTDKVCSVTLTVDELDDLALVVADLGLSESEALRVVFLAALEDRAEAIRLARSQPGGDASGG